MKEMGHPITPLELKMKITYIIEGRDTPFKDEVG